MEQGPDQVHQPSKALQSKHVVLSPALVLMLLRRPMDLMPMRHGERQHHQRENFSKTLKTCNVWHVWKGFVKPTMHTPYDPPHTIPQSYPSHKCSTLFWNQQTFSAAELRFPKLRHSNSKPPMNQHCIAAAHIFAIANAIAQQISSCLLTFGIYLLNNFCHSLSSWVFGFAKKGPAGPRIAV